jgi:uncharacterized repeat protein (TIGR02543 family)
MALLSLTLAICLSLMLMPVVAPDSHSAQAASIGVVSSHPSKDKNYLKATATSGSATSKSTTIKFFKSSQSLTLWAKGATKKLAALKLNVEFRPVKYALSTGWSYSTPNVIASYAVKSPGPSATKANESFKTSLKPGVYTAAVFYHEYATNYKYGIWADLTAANSQLNDVKYLTFVVTCASQTTFDANSGKFGSKTTLQKTHNYGKKPGKVAAPKKKGYTFKGFYTSATGGTRVFDASGYVLANVNGYSNSAGDWQRTAATKLYAQWELSSDYREISFDVRGGKNLSASQAKRLVKKGAKIGSLPSTSRSGYKFKGWYTKSSGGNKITAKSKVSKAQTFYAQWQKK